MSIRLRLTLWYSTILAVTLLVFGVALYFSSSYMMISDLKKQMKQLSHEIGPVKPKLVVGDTLVISLPPLDAFNYPDYFIQARNQNGKILETSRDFSLPISFEQDQTEPRYTKETIQGVHFLVYHVPTPIIGTNKTVLLQIAVVTNDKEHTLSTLKLILFALSVFTIMLAATLGWFLARKTLKPIENVIAAAAQIERGADLGVRIEHAGPQDEIGRLTNTINGMLSRIQGAYNELEESDRAQRRFVSDASHELRTPLTTIRGNVELLEKMWRQKETESASTTALADPEKMAMSLEAMRDIAGEAARMSRLVNDLLALARADAGHQMLKESVLIREVVDAAARKAQHLPRLVEWQIGDLAPLDGIGVFGDKDYLQQMLFIFIENAFKYTEEGYVRMDAVRSDSQVGIRIADTGIGMDKEEVPHIFERFFRADVSRGKTSGTGLGLSIAKWIMDEHGGSIEVTTLKGDGTTFIIWLPISFHQLEE